MQKIREKDHQHPNATAVMFQLQCVCNPLLSPKPPWTVASDEDICSFGHGNLFTWWRTHDVFTRNAGKWQSLRVRKPQRPMNSSLFAQKTKADCGTVLCLLFSDSVSMLDAKKRNCGLAWTSPSLLWPPLPPANVLFGNANALHKPEEITLLTLLDKEVSSKCQNAWSTGRFHFKTQNLYHHSFATILISLPITKSFYDFTPSPDLLDMSLLSMSLEQLALAQENPTILLLTYYDFLNPARLPMAMSANRSNFFSMDASLL